MSTTQASQYVRVRRANKVAAVGKHYTLTSVMNTPTKKYAFAVGDDGAEEIYIPGTIVQREQITAADIGAGFTCVTTTVTRFDQTAPHPHARLPIWWDGEAETVATTEIPGMAIVGEEEDDPELDKLEQDLDDLANATDKLLQYEGQIVSTVEWADKMKAELTSFSDNLGKLLAEIKTTRTVLDRVCPELDQ